MLMVGEGLKGRLSQKLMDIIWFFCVYIYIYIWMDFMGGNSLLQKYLESWLIYMDCWRHS